MSLHNNNSFVIVNNIVVLMLMRIHPHGVVHRLDSNVTSQDWSPWWCGCYVVARGWDRFAGEREGKYQHIVWGNETHKRNPYKYLFASSELWKFSITPLEKENYTVTVSRNDAPLPFFLVKSQCFADEVSFLINCIMGAHEAGDAETWWK